MEKIFLTNLDYVPGYVVVKDLGMVSTCSVRSKSFVTDSFAFLKNIFGGELKGYTEMLEEARRQVMERIEGEAKKRGGNAVLNIRLTTASVAAGSSVLYGYGTVVIIKREAFADC